MRVAIFTDEPGWHGAVLQKAFLSHNISAKFVSLNQCGLAINVSQLNPFQLNAFAHNQCLITIPGFEDGLPDAVFVRGVAGGTLQQVIMRLNILHILQQLGVLVYNAPRAIERTVDKAMTSFLLQHHAVNTPATWVCESRQMVDQIRLQYPQTSFVLKPLFGSQGVGVSLIPPDMPTPVPMLQHVDGVYYLQAFIESQNSTILKNPTINAHQSHDFRVFVISGDVIAAMRRTGQDWINNVGAGGQCEHIQPSPELVNIALAAAKAVDIHYCGVDIIKAYGGEYFVLEVNSIPAWRGLQGVSQIDIANALVEDFLFTFKQLPK
jgi:tetrahydromethanopterin:alpha-L-glutamate ligase